MTSDWLSARLIWIMCFLPSPPMMPSGTAFMAKSTHQSSALANSASGPVLGETRPRMMSRPASGPALTVVVGAAVVVVAGSGAGGGGLCRRSRRGLLGLAAGGYQPAEPGTQSDSGSRRAGDLEKVTTAHTLVLHIPLLSGYSTQKAETGTAYLLILASQTPPGNPVSKYSLR